MVYRFFQLDKCRIGFSRDADSRINQRDRWCIDQFINSDKNFHIIRDHDCHQQRIMGGMFGIKNNKSFNYEQLYKEYIDNNHSVDNQAYCHDQQFLENKIYPLIKNDVLIHTNIVLYEGETNQFIECPHNNTNFVGNVILFDDNDEEYPEFKYTINYKNRLHWLRDQKSWNIIDYIEKNTSFEDLEYTDKHILLDESFIASYWLNDVENCQRILSKFETTYVSDHIIKNSNFLFDKLRNQGYKIIATTDINRQPKDNEIIIYYGNFLMSWKNLPATNKIYRHPIYFKHLNHDCVEYDSCWEKVDQIYVLNLDVRNDRYMEIMVELCRLNVPLDRVYHYVGKKEKFTGDTWVDVGIGSTMNRRDCVNMFLKNDKFNNILIFEDDITFTTDIITHKRDMKTFFDRKYDYDICLLCSKKDFNFHPYDDLLLLSKQNVTSCGGYLISKQGTMKAIKYFEDGIVRMKRGESYRRYVCDVYWNEIQKDNKFFIFRNKFGYQRPGYSNVENKTFCRFD